MNPKKAIVIGSGIGGLAVAIRLAKKGYKVTVLEKNSYGGGKLSEVYLDAFRFDKGPSLFTLPNLIDELTALVEYPKQFNYFKLDTITHYFYEDGTRVNASADISKFAHEIYVKLEEEEVQVYKHLKRSKYYYDTTADLFLTQSLSQIKNFLNLKTFRGIIRAPRLGLTSTMHKKNAATFKNKKTVQLFDRYATYNGSNPYKAPALLNIIPHLEFGQGAFLPQEGMHQITSHLLNLAAFVGVEIQYNATVSEIIIEKDCAIGVKSDDVVFKSDIVISDADIHTIYNRLLPKKYYPRKLLNQEKSSSAYVFYWGIKGSFPALGLHNILFSDNYKREFDCIFNTDKPDVDPTIYINITSKYCKKDAPENSENWFVMVNVPHHQGTVVNYASEVRKNVIAKVNRMLQVDIEKHIVVESKLDPIDIEKQTSSYGGSLYGNSSNNMFSAFLRHANYSSKIKGLYFVGGSVHPGGGIPLCLLSAKIATQLISDKESTYAVI